MISAGELDRRIVIEQAAEQQDAAGQPIPAWLPFARVWAKYQPVPGGVPTTGQPFEGQHLAPRLNVDFVIRRLEGLRRDMRIRYEADVFEIVDIADVGRREGHKIRAYARPA